MGDRDGGRSAAVGAGVTIAALGAGLTVIHLVHGADELTGALPAVLYGAVIPLAVSVALVGGGAWVARRKWPEVSPWHVVGWCAAGAVVGLALTALLIQYQAAEGVTVSDQFFVLAMFATYGGAIGLLLGRYDVHRRAQQRQQEDKTQRLDAFASIVSHDLRNPLTVAEGRLELARERHESEDLEHATRALERMRALIETLLTLARTGESVTDRVDVDLRTSVEESWAAVDTAEASLVVDVECSVRADPVRLKQLLENLVRNAVEHGGSDVAVTVGELRDGFYVADDGPGVPGDERDRIFENGYSTTAEGLGYGLSIVREIANAHGWAIAVTESDEGGARFEVTGVEAVADRG